MCLLTPKAPPAAQAPPGVGPPKPRGSSWRPPECPCHERFERGVSHGQLASIHLRESHYRGGIK